MEAGKDPRTDQHPNRPGGPSPEVGQSNPKAAEGGAGTGTKSDPTSTKNDPGAAPHKQQ